MRDYLKDRAKAKRIVEKFGAPCEFVMPDGEDSGYDKFGNIVSNPSNPEQKAIGIGVRLEFDLKDFAGTTVITTTNIQHGDCRFIFYCESGKVEIGMVVDLNGKSWRVINPGEFTPVDTNIFYDIQLRAA